MLCLTRKFGESVVVQDADTGRPLTIRVERARRRDAVRLLFTGDRRVVVSREELLHGCEEKPSANGVLKPTVGMPAA